jgi:hypothetical protein
MTMCFYGLKSMYARGKNLIFQTGFGLTRLGVS